MDCSSILQGKWEEFQGEPGSSLAVCEAYNWWKGHVGAFFFLEVEYITQALFKVTNPTDSL